MRNPFKRAAAPETTRPTLRERLAATKAKAKQVLAVNAVLSKPAPVPAPAAQADRAALVNYATFLWFERSRVCDELYPHMGVKASRLVLTANAAARFFYPDGVANGLSKAWRNVPPASTRAVKVLDLVGVDWRSDAADGGLAHVDLPSGQDTGERPPVPHRWPTIDAALTEALDDLTRLDAAMAAMSGLGLMDERNPDTVPGYEGIEDARGEALNRMESTRAESLIGLQAKARALLAPSVSETYEDTGAIALSLARDLLGGTNRIIEPHPDPIFSVIEESRRLQTQIVAASRLPQPAGTLDPLPEQIAAIEAFNDHATNAVLTTVPNTAQRCRALARYVAAYQREQATPLDEDDRGEQSLRVLDLIARSPLI